MKLSELLKSINTSNANEMYAEVISSIMEGEESPLQMFVGLTILKNTLDDLRERLMTPAINELEKYGRRDVAMYNALLSIEEAGITWDFSVCDFQAWNDKKDEEALVKSQIKDIEKILKLFHEKPFMTEYINEDTAEIIERKSLKSSPIRKSTTIVKVKFPKKITVTK